MRTALDFLIEWTENLNWKSHLLNTVIKGQKIDIERLTDDIINLQKTGEYIKPLITLLEDSGLGEERLYITEIKDPTNINALDSTANCILGKNLNVFYGENGSGKSSYVKAFRRLAENYYTSEKDLKVQPNVYTAGGASDEQTITVNYLYGDEKQCGQKVNINCNHNHLSKVNIFDSNSVIPLLNEDLTFSVMPQGFNYFLELTSLIDGLKANFERRIKEKDVEQAKIFEDSSFEVISDDINFIKDNLFKESEIESFLNTNYPICAGTNINMEIKNIDNQIKEIQNANPSSIITLLTSQKLKLTVLKDNFILLSKMASKEMIYNVNNLVKEYDKLLEKEKKHNEEFGSKVQHIPTVNDEWIAFIDSAKQYYKSLDLGLPKVEDECIFCGQGLAEEQIDLIRLCFNHLDSKMIISKREIEQEIQAYYINEVAATLSVEEEQLFHEDKKILIEKIKTIINFIEDNKKIFIQSLEDKKIIPSECVIVVDDIVKEISKEIYSIDNRLANLGKSNQEISEKVENLEVYKKELLRKKKIYESTGLFKEWHKCKVCINFLKKEKSKLTTTSLTKKSKEAFKEIVANDYINIFNKYCNELGVSNVNIKFNPQKGQTKRSKHIVNENIKITDIMSEGEQKAIAVAEFITDLTIRKNYCTIIFDDPVTSFDYKNAEKIAGLIYELSKERQVLIFTHNIMFYYFLYNCLSKDKEKKKGVIKENRFFKIEEFNRDNKGLISLSGEGRLETLKQITGKINKYDQDIQSRACLGDKLEEVFKVAYSDIRTWCELIVEEGFLKKIIRRYEPHIQFGAVTQITSEFIEYLPEVSDLFKKSCRYMLGHSQPTETQNIKPSREEFDKDVKFVLKLSEKYKS